MNEKQFSSEENLQQILETFNADETEIIAFLENPKRYLTKLGVKELEGISDEELRKMVQNHVER